MFSLTSPTSNGQQPPGERGSLKPLVDAIPPEAYENPAWKGLAYFGRDLLAYLVLVALLIRTTNPFLVLLLEVPTVLVVSGLFIVAHDAAHGALFARRGLNAIIGRIAMLPVWHVYEGWVVGHNRIHHRYAVCQGLDFVWHPYTSAQYAAMRPLTKLRHRVEWSWWGVWLYYLREIWWSKMVVGRPPANRARTIRNDRLLVAGFVGAASSALATVGFMQTGTVQGSAWMVCRVLVLPVLGFSFMIGWFVHVHHVSPGIRWWSRQQWTKYRGQVDGTTIFRAPRVLNLFIHWIMVHLPHHIDVRIPMYHLELAAESIRSAYPDAVQTRALRFGDFVSTTRQCKLYEFEAGAWLTYRQAVRTHAKRESSIELIEGV